MSVNEPLRQMIRDLGRLLSEAILESADASEAVQRLREEGYSLYLLVGPEDGRKPAETKRNGIPLQVPEGAPQQESPEAARPDFVIHSQDLAFLRSLGIDPTRSLRRRRKP